MTGMFNMCSITISITFTAHIHSISHGRRQYKNVATNCILLHFLGKCVGNEVICTYHVRCDCESLGSSSPKQIFRNIHYEKMCGSLGVYCELMCYAGFATAYTDVCPCVRRYYHSKLGSLKKGVFWRRANLLLQHEIWDCMDTLEIVMDFGPFKNIPRS